MKNMQRLMVIAVTLAAMVISALGADITVSGTVVDSISGDPISDVAVILATGTDPNNIDTLDTVFTDENGEFSTEVTVEESAMGIIYVTNKEGYNVKVGFGMIQNDNVDLGTIKLVADTPIKYNKTIGFKKVPHNIPNNVMIYSLRGQLLYSGPELNLNNLFRLGISQSQPIIARFKFNNTVLYCKEIIPLH